MELLFDGPEDARDVLVLAHGAGAGMRHPWMTSMAGRLGDAGLRIARFEFPYMARRIEGSRAGLPDTERVLRATWIKVVERLGGGGAVVVGGKSMGGRTASMIADDVGSRGLVCLGYPFHPTGRPERLRTAHLDGLRTPALFVQGTRDIKGSREEVAGYALSHSIRVHWLEDGDHSFAPRKASGHTAVGHLDAAAAAVVEFVRGLR
ncbi:MAG: alpha/beta hydrolase [Dehalococcoidia bacterium]|nr:alpha/beta hydrolase [Dehalococcoidia bacterium]